MQGEYLKRKFNNFCKWLQTRPYEIRRFFTKLLVRNKDFSIISNNCWAGRVYQYLDMPYLSPTAGLYFFAPDYIKFVSDLHKYLDTPLEFINAEESKYYDELKERNQTDKPIGILDDVEIVFLHYKTREEAKEKWDRRKERVNYDHIILKMSRMNLCTEKELEEFDQLNFSNKLIIDNRKIPKYDCEVYYNGKSDKSGLITDTVPFPNNLKVSKLLKKPIVQYPKKGLK